MSLFENQAWRVVVPSVIALHPGFSHSACHSHQPRRCLSCDGLSPPSPSQPMRRPCTRAFTSLSRRPVGSNRPTIPLSPGFVPHLRPISQVLASASRPTPQKQRQSLLQGPSAPPHLLMRHSYPSAQRSGCCLKCINVPSYPTKINL